MTSLESGTTIPTSVTIGEKRKFVELPIVDFLDLVQEKKYEDGHLWQPFKVVGSHDEKTAAVCRLASVSGDLNNQLYLTWLVVTGRGYHQYTLPMPRYLHKGVDELHMREFLDPSINQERKYYLWQIQGSFSIGGLKPVAEGEDQSTYQVLAYEYMRGIWHTEGYSPFWDNIVLERLKNDELLFTCQNSDHLRRVFSYSSPIVPIEDERFHELLVDIQHRHSQWRMGQNT